MTAAPEFTDAVLKQPDAIIHGIQLGDAPRILLLHAGAEHAGVFRPVMRRLHESGFSSIAFDQRGHGRSTNTARGPLTQYADDARAMIASLDRPLVAGCSLGGLALMMALAEMETRAHVTGLALLDIIPDPSPERARHYLATAIGADANNPVIAHILSFALQLRDHCMQLDMPVTLIRAGRDTPLDDAGEARFLELIPHAECLTIDEASHLIAQTAPEPLAAALTRFAEQVLPDARWRPGCAIP
tara:strand:- start:14164 stop:14895 length:732 start_codon:yes stop_codon:yes gene_type:complete